MRDVYFRPGTLQKVGQGDKHDKILSKFVVAFIQNWNLFPSFQHKRTILQSIQEFKAPSLRYLSTYKKYKRLVACQFSLKFSISDKNILM